MLCLSALAAGACAVAEDAGGGAPSAEPPPGGAFLNLDEGDLPFDALTLWSAQRFLDGSIFGRFIRGQLQNEFTDFIPDANLDPGNDILMVELLFDNAAGASELEFELNGDNGQFTLILNSATALAETSAVYPTAWIEVTSPATEDGDISFINPRADDPLDVKWHVGDDEPLTLAPGATARVWLPFVITPGLEERPIALRYQPASGDPVEFVLID